LTHDCPARISLFEAHGIDSTRGPTFGDVTGHEEVNTVPHDNSVFHAILKLLPHDDLELSVERHGAAHQARDFSFKSQFVAMLYAQLSGASSLREIEAGMRSHANRLYHLGVRPAPRTTLADANRQRPVAVFSDLLGVMIERAHRRLRRVMDGATYLIDSTSLMLNQRSADWAGFSAKACGAKLHVIYDPDADCPIYAAISAANVNDITAAQTMPIVAGATYVYDLGYYDYAWWTELDAAGCRIVTRLKRNTPLAVTETRAVEPGGAILSDRVGHLPGRQAYSRRNPFQMPVREVQVKIDTGKVLRIVTNDLAAPAQQIAGLYKRRWAIELFFRWVKQTLRITRFIGTTENAVRIQIAVALIAFLLLRLAQQTQTAITSPLAFARLVRANLMHLRSLRQLREPPQRATPIRGQGVLI
jgi:transposase